MRSQAAVASRIASTIECHSSMLLLRPVLAAATLLSPATPGSVTLFEPDSVKALFEEGTAACAICSIDPDSAATAETLRELQDLRRARDVRASELSFDPALVSGDEATVSMAVRLDLSECRGPGGWHEARVRHYLASLRRTGGAWELRTLIWREEMLATQLVAAQAEERAPLLAANPELVGGELARALYRRGLALINSATPGAAEPFAALALDIARKRADRGAEALAVGLRSIIARKKGLADLSASDARESLSIGRVRPRPS